MKCDECEKEITDNNYYVDYFGFITCTKCKENEFWLSDSEGYKEENKLFRGDDNN